jgi:cobalamin biosynthesis Mg chelatase CobN
MACFPGLAQAEESSGIQYETDVPTVPDNTNIPPKKHSGGSNASDEPSAEASGANPQSGGGSGGNGDSTNGGAGAGQGNQAQGGDGGQARDGSQRAGGDVEEAQPIKTVSGVSDDASDGDSSPLVPILIAIAVLAAISIGAFYYRQRRQGPGSPISPNAS